MENHHATNGNIHYKWQLSIAMLVYRRVVEGEIYKQHQTTINHAFPYPFFGVFNGFHEQIPNKQCNEQPYNHLEVLKSLKSTCPCELVSETLVDLQGLGLDYFPLWSSKHPWHSSSGPDLRGWSTNPSEWPASRIGLENCPLIILDAPIENGVCP